MRMFEKLRMHRNDSGRSYVKGKGEIGICLATGMFAIFLFCVLSRIWNMELSIPLSYTGDVSGLLIIIKTILREETWWNFDGLGAPFQTNMWRSLMDGVIPNAIIFAVAKLTKSVGYAINFYYILSYGLYGMCAYYMLRKAGVKKGFSIVGAILYAFIPGHYQREETHLYVGSCFAIPLLIVVAMNLITGKMCKLGYVSKMQLTTKELIRSNSREQNLGLLFLVIITFCTLYYGIFSLMLLTFCAVYCAVTKKQLRHLYYYIQYVLIEIICIAIIYFPQLIANKFSPCIENVNIVTRGLGDVETFAGKLIQYILPVSGHRISHLAKLRALYDSTFFLVNENGMASLGLIMSIGFLVALVACFFSKEKVLMKYDIYGKMELFLFFVSTVGGLGVIVGFINFNLRCYNRFSYFIGAVGIIVSMRLLQDSCFWIEKNKKFIKFNISCFACLLILGIGICDQTTAEMRYTKEQGDNLRLQYYNDAKFVREIEEYTGQDADVLVFPIMNAQQAIYATTQKGIYTCYNDQMLFIHSNTSDWSVCSKAGEAGERWLNWLQYFDEETQIEIAAIVGFSGIAIYYGGYDAKQLNIQLVKLEEILGAPVAVHDSGTWAFYSLEREYSRISEIYSTEEIEMFREKYLNEYLRMRGYNTETLFTTSEKEGKNEFILTKGTWQYGPYDTFTSGQYAVEIYGSNLDFADIDCISSDGGVDIRVEEYSSHYVKYYVSFDADADRVEFRTFNAGDAEVIVNRIEVNRMVDNEEKRIGVAIGE